MQDAFIPESLMNAFCIRRYSAKSLYVKYQDGESAQYDTLYNATSNNNIKNAKNLYIFAGDPNNFLEKKLKMYDIFIGANKGHGHFLAKEVVN